MEVIAFDILFLCLYLYLCLYIYVCACTFELKSQKWSKKPIHIYNDSLYLVEKKQFYKPFYFEVCVRFLI